MSASASAEVMARRIKRQVIIFFCVIQLAAYQFNNWDVQRPLFQDMHGIIRMVEELEPGGSAESVGKPE